MQQLILLSSLLMLVHSQAPAIDPGVLTDIFGTPPTTTSTSPSPGVTVDLRDQTVRPTDSTSMFTDSAGQPCKCVPYYLCNANLVGVNVNNETTTGWGKLDIRFGEEGCQVSIERCCTSPKSPDEVPVPDAKPRLAGCGHSNPNGLDFSITGGTGTEAEFGEYPWVVALMAINGTYAGVGVLIHPQVVMTGAHIVKTYLPGELKIRAGEWDTQTSKERLPSQERIVSGINMHPDFHSKSLRNDMALLQLDAPLQLMDHINVICLPNQDESFENYKKCVANGWGNDVFGVEGRYAVILKKVTQDMVPHARCNALLQRSRLGSRFQLHSSFVCAGGKQGEDTCKGDGGAPLACPIGDNRYKLSGLVAWGIGCGEKDHPAVYVNVAAFRNWIDTQMEAWGFDTQGYSI